MINKNNKNNKNNFKYVLITLLLMVMLFQVVSAATYYVSPSGDDTTGDGSEANPWKTIASTLYNGQNAMTNGDVLMLLDGVYEETAIALDSLYSSKTVSIIGKNKNKAVVYCDDCSRSVFFMDNPSLGGFSKLANFNISNNIDDNRNGIELSGKLDGGYVENMSITNCKRAIYYSLSSSNTITQGNIENVYLTATDSSCGIQLSDVTSGVSINNITLTGNVCFNINFSTNTVSNITVNDEAIIGSSALLFYNETTYNNIKHWDFNYVNFDEQNKFIIENETFILQNQTSGSSYSIIDIVGSSNIIIRNNSFGTQDAFIERNTSDAVYAISMYSLVHNIDIIDNEFYINGITSAVMGSSLNEDYIIDNINIINNFVNSTGNVNSILGLSGCYANSSAIGNVIHVDNNYGSYALRMGVEGRDSCIGYRKNVVMNDNTIYATRNVGEGPMHTFFAGYNTNITMQNNNVYGGQYNYVIKGNDNFLFENNYAEYGLVYGVLHKGGSNGIYKNVTIKAGLDSAGQIAFSLHKNTVDSLSETKNISLYDISIIDSDITNNLVVVFEDSIVDFHDVIYNTDKTYIYGEDTKVNILYSIISAGGNKNTKFTIIDNSSVEDTYIVKDYEKTYYLSGVYEGSDYTDYSHYTWEASQYGETETGSFVLDAPYILRLPVFHEYVSGIKGISSTAFVAFGLLAVALLASIAFMFVKMFEGGFDAGILITMVVMSIGIAIVLLVGYIIISAVAGGLLI